MSLNFQRKMQNAFAEFYNNSNYPTTVASELSYLLRDKYENNEERFFKNFVEPTQKLLKMLQQNRMPLHRNQDQTIKIIVHLAIKREIGVGEFLFCVGHTKPGTLTVRFCKYVTLLDDGTKIATPSYDVIKMTVQKDSYTKCLTLKYFEDLRHTGKLKGTERTSVMFRLCWVKVLDHVNAQGYLKVYDAEDLLESTARKPQLNKGYSAPPVPVQDRDAHPPQQVSDEVSFQHHHPMVKQPACEDESNFTINQGKWIPDPTGMGEGHYENFNSLQTPNKTSSDAAVVETKFPVNEWQSENSDWPKSLRSNVSGVNNDTHLDSRRDQAATKEFHESPTKLNFNSKSSQGQIYPAEEVCSGYTREFQGVGPTGAGSLENRGEGENLNSLAKSVQSGYAGEFQSVGPKATRGKEENQKNVPRDSQSQEAHPAAKDVCSGYTGEYQGVGPI